MSEPWRGRGGRRGGRGGRGAAAAAAAASGRPSAAGADGHVGTTSMTLNERFAEIFRRSKRAPQQTIVRLVPPSPAPLPAHTALIVDLELVLRSARIGRRPKQTQRSVNEVQVRRCPLMLIHSQSMLVCAFNHNRLEERRR